MHLVCPAWVAPEQLCPVWVAPEQPFPAWAAVVRQVALAAQLLERLILLL